MASRRRDFGNPKPSAIRHETSKERQCELKYLRNIFINHETIRNDRKVVYKNLSTFLNKKWWQHNAKERCVKCVKKCVKKWVEIYLLKVFNEVVYCTKFMKIFKCCCHFDSMLYLDLFCVRIGLLGFVRCLWMVTASFLDLWPWPCDPTLLRCRIFGAFFFLSDWYVAKLFFEWFP